jgi:outer membrane receptor protein involved in Fe transport
MAPRKGKAQTNSSLAISVVVHVAAIGGIFYFAHKTGMLPQQIYKITGIKAPEEKKEKPKPKPPEDTPPKQSEIQETVETPPDAAARPPADVPLTARTGNPDAPAARGNGGFSAQARPQGAKPVNPIQAKPGTGTPGGTGTGTTPPRNSVVAPAAANSAFSEARTKPSTVESVLEERKNAASAQESVSSEQISRTGSGDAAQVVTKVTGVVAVDNKQVVVRGLSDRYNVSTLNGAELPSADPRRRAAQLDLIPSAMIDRVVVSKTFTPDLQGGFAGGSVNIVTKSFPAKAFTTLTVGMGYNTVATGNDQFLSAPGSSTDWLGMDDGLRSLPSEVFIPRTILDRPTPGTPDILNQYEPLRIEAFGAYRPNQPELRARRLEQATAYDNALRSFKTSTFAPTGDAPGPNRNFALASGDTSWLFGHRVGWFASLNYEQKARFEQDAFRGRYNSEVDTYDGGPLQRLSEFNVDRSIEENQWGAVATLAYELMPGHELGLTYVRNQNGTAIGSIQNGKVFGFDQFNPVETSRSRLNVVSWQERVLENVQAKGHHVFGEINDFQADWLLSLASTAEETPDLRIFPMRLDPQPDGTYIIEARNPDLPNVNFPTRLFRESSEENGNFKLDLTMPFTPGNGLESALKGGIFTSGSTRKLTEHRFSYLVPSGTDDEPSDYANSVLDFNGPRFTEVNAPGGRRRFQFGDPLFDTSFIGPYGYDGRQVIQAAYLMGDFFVHPKLRLVGGARAESTRLSITPFALSRLPGDTRSQITLNADDVLPSAGAVFLVSSNVNVRLNYSGTLARPTYREFGPVELIDVEEDLVVRGNPELKRTTIENYDARVEWFPRPGELVSLGIFQKDLKDPIERFYLDPQNNIVSFTNRPNAVVRGVEFEVRKKLDFVDPLLHDFSIGGNYSYIDSQVDVPYSGDGVNVQVYNRTLFDQPAYVLNADLGYDNPRTGTSFSFVFSRTGERLALDVPNAPNAYEQPINTLDVFFSQRLGRRWKLRFGARNLLDPEIRTIFVSDFGGSRNDFGGNYVFRSYKRGITYSLSLSAEF